MANIRLYLPAGTFSTLLAVLNTARDDAADEASAGAITRAINDIQDKAILGNDDEVETVVTSVTISTAFKALCITYDDAKPDEYLKKLMDERQARHDAEERAKQEQEAREKWLDDCVAKYAGDLSLSCADIASLINQNDLEPGMKPLRYQTIMHNVRKYRQNTKVL